MYILAQVDDLNPSEEDGGVNKLAPNLFYLGVSGTATVEGLSVAFLGGVCFFYF